MERKMLGRGWHSCLVSATLVAVLATSTACTHHNDTSAQVDASAVGLFWPDAAAPVDPPDGGLVLGEIVETADGFQTEGSAPLVAMDEQGNAIVAWHVQSGVEAQTVVRRYTAGTGWSDIELVMKAGYGYATSVALRGGTGLMALVGQTAVDAGFEAAVVYAASFTTAGWSVLPVGATTTGWWQDPYTPPPVAVLGQSGGLVAWIDGDQHNGLTAATFVDGAWQPAQSFGGVGDDPTASVLPSGGLAVARRDCHSEGTSTSCDLLVSSWDRAAGWLPAAALVESQLAGKPKLAVDNGGRPHLLSSGTESLMHAELLPSGEWSAGEAVVADNHVSISDQHLVTDLASNALVAWTFQPGAWCDWTVESRYFVEGAGWQDAIQVNPPESGTHSQLADLAMAPNGEAWALWRTGNCDASDEEIWARHFAPATAWNDPVKLDSGSSVSSGAVAMGGNRTLAAWSRGGRIVVRWLQ
jgi:hypothetical protein